MKFKNFFSLFLTYFFTLLFFNSSLLARPMPTDLFVNLGKELTPSVVNISTTFLPKSSKTSPRNPYSDPFFLFLERYYGRPIKPQPKKSLGSGFIIREDGLIITNNHVVDGADVIKVQLSNDKTLHEAQVIGKDRRTDIALIKINVNKKLKPASMGNSSQLQVGEWVTAFGNPYGHSNTMTVGIVSAIGRHINELNRFEFIQIDASINPGNSGGPLVNTKGEVIGVNTAVFLGKRGVREAQGIAFAIPINDVKNILPTLEKDGYIKRGFVGLLLAGSWNMSIAKALKLKNTEGALITEVIANSPAHRAKLQPYDVIIEFNGKKIISSDALIRLTQTLTPGQQVSLKIYRKGKKQTLRIRVGEHPDDKKRIPLKKNTKTQKGKKAPFNLGFRMVDYNKSTARKWRVGALPYPRPIVVEVTSGSPAARGGLLPGDTILDVNQKPIKTTEDIQKNLKKNKDNFLRVLRKGDVFIIDLPYS